MGTTTEYEFGGPFGAFMTMVSLPAVIVFLYVACGKDLVVRGVDVPAAFDASLVPSFDELWSWDAVAVCLLWFAFLVVLERVLPGEVVPGSKLPPHKDGPEFLEYKLNGHLTFWVSLPAVYFACDLTWIYDQYLQLAVAASVLSALLSLYLYAMSFRPGAQLAAGGDTGNPVYDFFIGRELNPRIGSFDWKEFCELRPGLIGWVVINLGMLQKQQEQLGYVSDSMWLVVAAQALYVWDSLYMERAILTTMDITTDGFGFMLAFGDLAWVPFTYSLQARFLVDHDPQLSREAVAAVAAVSFLGYTVFRLSNSEKDRFRRNPNDPAVAHLKTMDTNKPGRKLLVSGWWGMARKINYTGDWLNGLSWSMATGTASIITYFYPIYFAVLLVHRAMRDDHMCTQKYGVKVWSEFKRRVPYVFIPYVI
eukprot:TRINITY_DN13819_c0_g1_i2.p1 TRINITY_DN13819_c0_g1~~TRINITY_DN13819_c0_g1_i2.p1  ORF type:complete len:422 (+),score=188.71 TRINITY_DN13819_c0_g1_i2:45-1310(+)